jgi:hypothetical protein
VVSVKERRVVREIQTAPQSFPDGILVLR